MATFVKHESCPSCGSRDNLARYSDGSAYCFGCRYTERGDKSPFVGERDGKSESNADGIGFPDDATNILDGRGLEWLAQYGLGAGEAFRAGFKWSPYWQHLLMPFYDGDGNLCCIQAKNFDAKRASKAKYYNVGEKAQSRTIYVSLCAQERSGVHRRLVLTEDAVSALVVSQVSDAKPLLGTSIPREQIAEIAKSYDELIVWLDDDKWREGRSIADCAKLLGMKTKTLLTDRDPKEFSVDDIKGLIQ